MGELGKGCSEGLVVCLFHPRKEGSAEGRGKACRCGKGGELQGAAKAMEVDLGLWRWVGQGLG